MSQPVNTPPAAPAAPAPTAPPAPPAAPPAPAPAPVQPPAPAGAPAPPAQPTYVPPPQLAPAQPPAPAQPQYVPVLPIAPAPPDPDDAGKDWTKLPQWAQQERQQLVDEAARRRISERTALVNQHAYFAAGQLGVNPSALIGSIAFGEAAKQLNANAADFPQKLTEVITTILATNPWMAAAPAPAAGTPGAPGTPAPPAGPTRSGGEFTAGPGAGTPITEEQLAAMTPAEVAKAFAEGRLKHLM